MAAQRPHAVKAPFGATRNDEFYWLRDDTRKNPEMLAYLAAENSYADAILAPGKPLADTVFNEIVSHIKQDDSSVPVRRRGLQQFRHPVVELAPPLQGPPLGVRVAAHPQQQRHVRQFGDEHLDHAPYDVLQAPGGGPHARVLLVEDPEEPVQRPADGQAQQLLLAGDVVVDRRLGDARRPGEVLHGGAVVAALVEHLDGDLEQRLRGVRVALGGGHGVPSRLSVAYAWR
jgi:hypothetical protein